MRVQVDRQGATVEAVRLCDADECSVEAVERFCWHLLDAGYSPNTAVAQVDRQQFRPAVALELLGWLRRRPSRRPAQRLGLTVATTGGRLLAPATVARVLAAVSSFYEWAITAEQFDRENPMQRQRDAALARVPGRHQPFTVGASRQVPLRRTVRVRLPARLPLPMGAAERDDHPRGVRQQSRQEWIVDPFEPRTLDAVSRYVMHERPLDATTEFVFLVGGSGPRRGEPLSHSALVRLVARHLERLGLRSPVTTSHALRHTHASRAEMLRRAPGEDRD